MTVSLAEGGAGLGSAWGEALARQMLTDAGSPTPAPSSPPGDESRLIYINRRD